jgi:hypothetical protein
VNLNASTTVLPHLANLLHGYCQGRASEHLKWGSEQSPMTPSDTGAGGERGPGLRSVISLALDGSELNVSCPGENPSSDGRIRFHDLTARENWRCFRLHDLPVELLVNIFRIVVWSTADQITQTQVHCVARLASVTL